MRNLLIIFVLLSNLALGQVPNYYNGIDFSKSGDSLKTQLHNLITSTHTNPLDYTSSINTDTWDALKQSDLKDGDTSNVLLIYGYDDLDAITQNDRTRNKDSSCHTSGCNGLWNREHVYPQSLANPSMTTQFPGTGTDLHNLRSVDGQENSSRGNDRFANGSGNSGNLSANTYYVGDEWRGDVARIIMYMYVRYGSECPAINVGTGSTSYSNYGDMPNIFLEWNAQDPPSQYEKNRNNIFHNLQGNRNPFIDNPFLATKIWNGPSALNNWGALSTSINCIKEFFVYPTFTRGKLYIKKTTNISKLKFSLFDSQGVKIKSGLFDEFIDLIGIAKGIYFLKFDDFNYPVHKVIIY